MEVSRQNLQQIRKLKSEGDFPNQPTEEVVKSVLNLKSDQSLSPRNLPQIKSNDSEGSSVDLPTYTNSDVLTQLVKNIMKLPMNPNRFVLGLYLDSVEGTSIKKQMVLNVNVTETVAGDEDRTHTMRSKIATGPNYNFAETFFVFLEYAHKVKVGVFIYSNPDLTILQDFH